MSEWREVCRWEEGPSREPTLLEIVDRGPAIDWKAVALKALQTAAEWFDLSDSLIACYEELAGEHEELRGEYNSLVDALNSPRGVVCSMPVAAPEQVAVRPYVRAKPRRSKPVETETTQGIVQHDGDVGQIEAAGEVMDDSMCDCGHPKSRHVYIDDETVEPCCEPGCNCGDWFSEIILAQPEERGE